MNTESYLEQIALLIQHLPPEDLDRSLAFYAESIADRMEEGMSEEEAVASMDPPEVAARAILMETPLPKLVKARVRQKRMGALEIVLLVLGFPLWFPLLLTALVLELSLYIVVWALLISLWAVELSVAVSVLGALGMAVAYFLRGRVLAGIAMLGAGLVCAGIAVFLFYGCVAASKGLLSLTKKAALAIKTKFLRKENER